MAGAVPFTLVIAPDGEVVYQESGAVATMALRRAVLANLPDPRITRALGVLVRKMILADSGRFSHRPPDAQRVLRKFCAPGGGHKLSANMTNVHVQTDFATAYSIQSRRIEDEIISKPTRSSFT